MGSWRPWATLWQRGHLMQRGQPTFSNGLGSPASCKSAGRRGHRGRCGGTPTCGPCRAPGGSSTGTWGSHIALGGSTEAACALAAALHASPVVWVQVAVFTYLMALLNCRRAGGHDTAHAAE